VSSEANEACFYVGVCEGLGFFSILLFVTYILSPYT